VRGKRLIERVLLGLALLVAWMTWLAAARANATPMQPDIRRMLTDQQQSPPKFGPARAGWHGSEMPRKSSAALNPEMERYSEASLARSIRASIAAAALPDLRVWFAIAVAILLLRRLRHTARPSAKTPEAAIDSGPSVRQAA
jgi:hypothetical protein